MRTGEGGLAKLQSVAITPGVGVADTATSLKAFATALGQEKGYGETFIIGLKGFGEISKSFLAVITATEGAETVITKEVAVAADSLAITALGIGSDTGPEARAEHGAAFKSRKVIGSLTASEHDEALVGQGGSATAVEEVLIQATGGQHAANCAGVAAGVMEDGPSPEGFAAIN